MPTFANEDVMVGGGLLVVMAIAALPEVLLILWVLGTVAWDQYKRWPEVADEPFSF